MNAETYLAQAVKAIESKSIREWAVNAHNKPIVLKLAQSYINHDLPVEKFTLFLVAEAIGLW